MPIMQLCYCTHLRLIFFRFMFRKVVVGDLLSFIPTFVIKSACSIRLEQVFVCVCDTQCVCEMNEMH